MKVWVFLLAFVLVAAAPAAQPVTLVNTLPDRPVLSFQTAGGVVTRTIAPGEKAQIEATALSALGQKSLVLVPGGLYYLARFGALPGVYRLAANQVLVVNQSGRAIAVTMGDHQAVLAVGNLALGELGAAGAVTLGWSAGDALTADLTEGGFYRFTLESPEGTGTQVLVTPWK